MRIAIIGGSGNMGKWFARHLLAEGMEVTITGRDPVKLKKVGKELGVPVATNAVAVKNADVVILSVPPDAFLPVVQEITPFVKKGQIIVDITSVKTLPVDIMQRYLKKGTVLGMHPVFGPGAKSLAHHNFVLTPTNDKEAALAANVKQYLEDRKASVAVMTPAAHDEMMTVVLALAHFIAIVAGDTLLRFEKLATMQQVGGTTFKLLYTLVESVISEDPQLYASLQMSFPDAGKVERQFIRNAQDWAAMVKNGDAQGFADRMSKLRGKLEKSDPSFRRAYDDMYKINEILK